MLKTQNKINMLWKSTTSRFIHSTSYKLQQQQQQQRESKSIEKSPENLTADSLENLHLNTDFQISTKLIKKLPAREPLVKNFCLGKVDTHLLGYPEAIEKENLTKINETLKTVSEYFRNNVDSRAIDATRLIPKNVFEDLQKYRIFGCDIPQHFGGRGYFTTEMCLQNECENEDVNISVNLNAHRLVTQILLEHGTEYQQNKYLSRLAKGDLVGTVAIFEPESSSNHLFNTTAQLSPDGDNYILSGKKSFVVNAADANLILVIARIISTDNIRATDAITAFLVEKQTTNSNNIIIEPRDITIGCGGVFQSAITFKGVPVITDNILGALDDGGKIVQKVLRNSRLQTGILSSSVMKKNLEYLIRYSLDTKQFGVKYMDMDIVQQKLGFASCNIYALESMNYLTAGIMDIYEDADVDVEAAIISVFAKNSLFELAKEAMNFIGPITLLSGQQTAQYFKDASHIIIQNEPIDALKIFIGASGLQYTGLFINDEVKKMRNPLFHPKFFMGRFFDRQNIDEPKMNLKLHEYLHPSLETTAAWLEESVKRIEIGTSHMLTRNGSEANSRQVEIIRLANCVILAYAMFACAARASRAYCIGLQYADYDIFMTNVFCYEAKRNIKLIVEDICKGPYLSSDKPNQKIAKQLFKSKSYFSIHPLTRNY